MADYRYSQLEAQLNGQPQYAELDPVKIQKLDKLLTKIDNDFKKKQKDITKPKLIEIMKTTHEIYQIVLYEISEMLEAARLSELRQSLNKIYNGQNIILNYILKLNTNFEVQADKMLETLQKNIQQPRRKSVDQSEVENRETNKMANQMVQLQPIVKKMIRKTFAEKATDTGDDMKEARNKDNLRQKEKELKEMQEEIDEEGKQIAEFLKNRKAEMLAVGESKAQNNLKEVLKDLGRKKRETNDIEEEALAFEEQQNKQNEQIKSLEQTLKDGISQAQKQAQEKAREEIKQGKAYIKNGVLLYLSTISIQTEKMGADREMKDQLDRARRELSDRDQKLLMLEKKVKDISIEREAYANQMQGLQAQLNKAVAERKKLEDQLSEERKKKEKQQQDQMAIINKLDSDKIRRVVEENIKMKMRIKNLIDNVNALEKELGRSFERFKTFIMNNPSLSEEQKKAIMAQAESLLRPNISEKLNMQEIKEILAVDELLKDPLFKSICGADLLTMTKNVKKDEQVRRQKLAKIPNYDPLFDPEFLNPDEKIVVRRVKKVVKRQNSKGDWVEEEQEVDEEVVVNAKGEELRVRDKPIVVQQSKETQQFVDAYGGFAVGGSKINLPSKPVAKDGREVKVGEWFEDPTGKKVRKLQGKEGEEMYEVEEEYVDEFGRKQKRVKQIKVKKDRNGNEIVEEEYVDAQGRRQKVAKRVTKDRDGNDIVEEILVDENGNKTTKKQKIYRDKDGAEIIEEEIVDSMGRKQVIKRKVVKDEFGNEVVIEEKVDAKGNKVITTKKRNEYGQEVVEQQIIDKFGRVQQVEKKAYVDKSGANVVEEVTFDSKGNKIVKKTKIRKDADGNDIVEEEIENADGTVTVKTQKRVKNADGSETIEEEVIDEKGNVVTVKKKVFKDKNGNLVTEEEHIDEKGNKVVVKTIKDAAGRETVQKQIVKADGTVLNLEKKVQRDADGCLVETEQVLDENGKMLTVQRKVFKDKDGIETVEEVLIDESGNQKTVKKKVIRDKDGNDVVEETTVNADGSKQVVKKKVYKDKEGNEITEIETLDAAGNKVVIRTKKAKNGEEVVEETRIAADGRIEKTVKKIRKDKQGNEIVEETRINADGSKTVKIIRAGMGDDSSQTDGIWVGGLSGVDQILQGLIELGLEKTKIEKIKEWITIKQQIANKKNQSHNQKNQAQVQVEEHQFQEDLRPASADSSKSLDTLDDEESDQDQADRLYKKMMNNKSGGMAELMRQVRNGLGKQGNEQITQEEFREYMLKMRQVHQKCGDNCPHLRRFYEKLGFIQKKYKRRFLKMKDTKIEAKTKLPYIQNVSSIKP